MGEIVSFQQLDAWREEAHSLALKVSSPAPNAAADPYFLLPTPYFLLR